MYVYIHIDLHSYARVKWQGPTRATRCNRINDSLKKTRIRLLIRAQTSCICSDIASDGCAGQSSLPPIVSHLGSPPDS